MALFNLKLPALDEQDSAKAVRQMRGYLVQLDKQLRYTLGNLSAENLSGELKDTIEAKADQSVVREQVNQVSDVVGGVSRRVNVGVDQPTTPEDGQLWFDTKTNRVLQYHDGSWHTLADYNETSKNIRNLTEGTIANTNFSDLINAVADIKYVASNQQLVQNLAKSMDFGGEGLKITSLVGGFYMLLGPQQLEFRKGTGTDSATLTTFGNLRTITSQTLQVGQPGSPAKVVIGNLTIERQTLGNVTFRKT